MFGNLINNRQLHALIKSGEVSIDPFNDMSLKATHYTLHPGRVLLRHLDSSWKQSHNFAEDGPIYVVEPNAYIVVEVIEFIRIQADGIVGRFIQSSNFIEAGLSLIAGQIDSKYGMKGERLRFGVKNLLSVPNPITSETRLAHVEFFDLRGLISDPVSLTQNEIERWSNRMRKGIDDGPDYGDGE